MSKNRLCLGFTAFLFLLTIGCPVNQPDHPASLAAPADFTVEPTSSSRITLSWTDHSEGESGYVVERGADGITFSPFVTLPADAVSYPDTGLASHTTYHYRVQAVHGSEYSDYSAALPGTTYALLSDIYDHALTPALNATGQEFSGQTGGSGGYTVTVIGTSCALPADLWAPPVIPAVPPANIYGCVNDVSLVIAPSADTIEFRFAIPVLFIDLTTTVPMIGTDNGYCLLTDLVVTATVDLTTLPNGCKQLNPGFDTTISYGTAEFHSQDPVVDALAGMFLPFITGELVDNLRSVYSEYLADVLADISIYEP